jgi:uncharacterized protein
MLDLALVALAALAAGVVNALAGGGSLITFPALVAIGVPPVAASVTNTVALCPGYLGATWAQRGELADQTRRLRFVVPVGLAGGAAGGLLLLCSGAAVFRVLVPFLILLAAGLLAAGEPIKKWLGRRAHHAREPWAWGAPLLGLAAVYGGYFGAGLSVMILAILGLVVDEPLGRVNALKQAASLVINLAAALLFVFTGRVVWSAALAMAVGALVGGALGGRLAGKVRPALLRWIVVTLATLVACGYLARL